MNDFPDKMLTVVEIKEIFRCGLRQAYEIVKMPGFPATRIGKKYLVSSKALEQWIDKNKGRKLFK